MTAVECKLIREGGTFDRIGTTDYHFAPQADGAHVAFIDNSEHADIYLSISEGYRLYRSALKPEGVIAATLPVATPAEDPAEAMATMLATEPETPADPVDERAELAKEYEALYGEAPHPRTGIKKLRELIAAKQTV